MKKLLALVLALVLTFSLAGCGSSDKKDDKEAQAEKYDSQEVTYEGNFKIKSTADEVTYNENDHTDNLIVSFKITNIGKEDAKFSSIANIIVKQGEDSLGYSQLQDKDGKWVYSLDADEDIKAGESKDLKGAWILKDPEADVVVSFNGWGFESGAGDMTFKVAGTESEEHAAYVKEQESILAAKKETKEASINGADIKIIDGWYLDDSSEDSAKITKEDKDDGVTPYVELSYSTTWGNAKKWSKTMNKNYGGKCKIDSVKVNGTNYVRMAINDSQFMLFADTKDGGAIRMYGMFINFKNAKKVIENITIK